MSKSSAGPPIRPLPDHLSEFVEDLRVKYGVSSIGVATVRKISEGASGEQWEHAVGGFGTANAQRDPVTPDSLFSIASNSKLITVIALGLLIESEAKLPDGSILRWDSKVSRIFPDLKLQDERVMHMLDLTDLLGMRSGLPGHDTAIGLVSPSELIRIMSHLKLSAEIRQTWQYSNMHYILAAAIIPILTGMPFHDYVQQKIFNPLKKTERWTHGSMRLGIDIEECRRRLDNGQNLDQSVLGEVKRFGRWTEENTLHRAGPGGAIMSLRDMTIWMRELQDPKIIPASLLKKAEHPLSIVTAEPSDPELGVSTYGLGQMVYTYRGYRITGHSGGLPGQNTLMLRLDDGYAIMVATNEVWARLPILNDVIYRYIDDHLGLKPLDWTKRAFERLVRNTRRDLVVPKDPVPPLSSERIKGRYTNLAYADLVLSVLPLDTAEDTPFHVDSKLFLNLFPHIKGTRYGSPMSKVFVDFIGFIPISDNVYHWVCLTTRPILDANGEESVQRGVVDYEVGTAIFTEDGLGMFGNFWGAGPDVPVTQADVGMEEVKRSAEVFFERSR
ncbi:beta-lactamase/transpeptidase-like protein [Kockovaella imperatae]|uniref:Beta-lactamase/transpeptidase-like protein n=1 Tax=Kockovaella imperatae TaxID=4999 RepID=A0A1Y1UF75_9TREE|nr:beta-lactamase/transpeptidase-like protein [Kockovaella imperatae]ORX36668.1 beta-lactamase/transpeptidase-like protein [Kockovaella imperatae]